MLDEATALERLGHEVIPFAAAHPDNLPTAFARYFPGFVETAAGGSELPPWRRAGVALDLIHHRQAARRFAALLDDVQPDVVHLHNPSRQLSPSVLRVAARRGVPVVLTLHDYALVCPQGQMLKGDREACRPPNCVEGSVVHAVTNRCVKSSLLLSSVAAAEHWVNRVLKAYSGKVAAMIAPSEFMRSMVVAARMAERPVHVVPNGVPDAGPLPSPGAGSHLLYLGRLSREKGLGVLSQAAAMVPEVRILVAGDGPQRAQLESAAPSNLTFLGDCSPERLRGLMADSVAVVSPSIWYENAPLSVLESLSAGRPVVASRIGGQQELVDESSGVLVPPADAAALAAAMRTLWNQRALADQLGAGARQRYLDRYTLDEHVAALLAVYALVLTSPGTSGSSVAR